MKATEIIIIKGTVRCGIFPKDFEIVLTRNEVGGYSVEQNPKPLFDTHIAFVEKHE